MNRIVQGERGFAISSLPQRDSIRKNAALSGEVNWNSILPCALSVAAPTGMAIGEKFTRLVLFSTPMDSLNFPLAESFASSGTGQELGFLLPP